MAIALIGVMSAFTTTTSGRVALKLPTGKFIELDPLLRGQEVAGGWDCFIGGEDCIYVLQDEAQPDQFGEYVEAQTDGVVPGEEEKHFEYIIPPTP